MKRNRGFTLLELMIVVAVVAILAGFAISAYTEQVRKAKRAEAMKGIAAGRLLMEKFRAFCPTYADQSGATNSCQDRNGDGDGSDAGDYAYPTIPAGDNYTFAFSGQSATGYTLTATKKSTFNDPKCGNYIWTVNANDGAKSMSSGDQKYCWP
jgi:type IV pilus assembly protein PilE